MTTVKADSEVNAISSMASGLSLGVLKGSIDGTLSKDFTDVTSHEGSWSMRYKDGRSVALSRAYAPSLMPSSISSRLQEIGPNYGYFPEPDKSILVVSKDNVEKAKAAFADLKFKVATGHHYLGGFISQEDAHDAWIQEMVDGWSEVIAELAFAAKRFPQSAYSGLQRSLQQEWQFVQRVTKGIGNKFAKVEEEISQLFLPALFDNEFEEEDP
jgi:hypothetical protein